MRIPDEYRPKKLDEIIGQDIAIKQMKNIVAGIERDGWPPSHMLFIGPPGVGKTTAAMAFAREVWGDEWKHHFKEYNASDTRGIDDVRERYKPISQHKGDRVLFLDESDQMTSDAQHSMRRIMEETPSTCFILSGNNLDGFIDALQSRCAEFFFRRIKDKDILRVLVRVCKTKSIDFQGKQQKEALWQLAKDSRGDIRSALNNLGKLIDENLAITTENVILQREAKRAAEALQKALDGDSEGAIKLIESCYIESGYNARDIVRSLYDALPSVPDEEVRLRLYAKLGELESNLGYGRDAIVQLASFIAYCWVAPRLMRCPAVDGG